MTAVAAVAQVRAVFRMDCSASWVFLQVWLLLVLVARKGLCNSSFIYIMYSKGVFECCFKNTFVLRLQKMIKKFC